MGGSDRAELQLYASPHGTPASSPPPAPPGYWHTAPYGTGGYPGCLNHIPLGQNREDEADW